ncbi:MAG TPA: hypothetical protein VID27_01970 [Blastocatellia bacterium]
MGKAEPGSKKSATKNTAATESEAKTAAKKTTTKTTPAESPKRKSTKLASSKPTGQKSEKSATAKATKPAKAEQEPVIAPRSEPPVETAPAPPPETKPAESAAPEERAAAELDNSVLPTDRGKVAIFGGPKDRSIKPDDKVALPIGRHFTYDRVRSLDSRGYYCAMRWNYRFSHMTPEEAKRWWANKKLLVTNPASGKSVVVRAVDYGPHEKTGLDIGLSPGAALALGVGVGDEVEIVFADQRLLLGPTGEE